MATAAWTAEWTPRAHALLRIVTGYMFLLHGTSKLFKLPHVPMFDNLQLMSLIGLAGVLEVVGGLLVLIGLFTRPVARLDPYSTPNPRLFLCSASTPPGGGVHGMCGYWAARSALERLASPSFTKISGAR